jgi:hypothetical protein
MTKLTNDFNTLFLIAKHGLRVGAEPGLLESWMWNLSVEDRRMAFLSLHKSKSDRANRGGSIVGTREASDQEVAEHQEFLRNAGKSLMQDTDGRLIIVFRPIPGWNILWPSHGKTNPMAYKALGQSNRDNRL